MSFSSLAIRLRERWGDTPGGVIVEPEDDGPEAELELPAQEINHPADEPPLTRPDVENEDHRM